MHQKAELLLVKYAVVVEIECAEVLCERGEELLVLPQLEVQDGLQEETELDFVLGRALLHDELLHLVASQSIGARAGDNERRLLLVDLRYARDHALLEHMEAVLLCVGIPDADLVILKFEDLLLLLLIDSPLDLRLKLSKVLLVIHPFDHPLPEPPLDLTANDQPVNIGPDGLLTLARMPLPHHLFQ